MAAPININTIEELYQFLNEKGVMEIALRGKNKKFRTFQKVTLNNLQQPEAAAKAQEAIALLNKNNHIAAQNLQMLGNISKLGQFTMVLSGLNLFATVIGFAIMNKKLNKVSAQIEEAIKVYKDAEDIHTTFTINEVLSNHANMLDCRKKRKYYSEDQMWKLVADEYNVLDMLMNIFYKNMSNNPEVIVFTMLSMASMLATSLKYFDEVYYFNNKEAIGEGDIWHIEHDKWTSMFEKMSTREFIEKIQDYGYFSLNLNTVENDCFYKSYRDQVKSLKQEVADNQKLITVLDDPDLLGTFNVKINETVKAEIEDAFKEVGADSDQFKKAISIAVA